MGHHYRVVFSLGATKLAVIRYADDDKTAYNNALEELAKIKKDELGICSLVSVTEMR